jgi:hypothetical protein
VSNASRLDNRIGQQTITRIKQDLLKHSKGREMKEYNLQKWTEFHGKVQEIRDQYANYVHDFGNGEIYTRKNDQPLLFRGLGDASWTLDTTLERATKTSISLPEYMRLATSSVHEIEAATSKNWKVKNYHDILEQIASHRSPLDIQIPHYDYLVYLRHHGFPSPLLDWSESPFIAAYFAAWESFKREKLAVYVYIETSTGSKQGTKSTIKVMGPHVTSHPRHFVQKAWYTVSAHCGHDDQCHTFCPHRFGGQNNEQDILVKITLPFSERVTILKSLDEVNINHYTLFQTEDSLIKALSMKHFDMSPD